MWKTQQNKFWGKLNVQSADLKQHFDCFMQGNKTVMIYFTGM